MGNLTRTNGPVVAVVLAYATVPALLMLWQARRQQRRDLLSTWASSHFLDVPPAHRRAVSAHLDRMAWLRGCGAAGGWFLGTVLGSVVPAGPWGGVLVGYVVAAVAGEVTAQRGLGTGVASLAPRRLEAYVPKAAVSAVRAVPLAGIALGVLPFLVERHATFRDADGPHPAVLAGGLVLLAVGGEALARWVVARRQTAGTPELLDVDDALRSTSAHLLVASVLALELVGLALVASESASTMAHPAIRWAAVVVAGGGFVAALATLHFLAGRPWRVRRELAGSAA